MKNILTIFTLFALILSGCKSRSCKEVTIRASEQNSGSNYVVTDHLVPATGEVYLTAEYGTTDLNYPYNEMPVSFTWKSNGKVLSYTSGLRLTSENLENNKIQLFVTTGKCDVEREFTVDYTSMTASAPFHCIQKDRIENSSAGSIHTALFNSGAVGDYYNRYYAMTFFTNITAPSGQKYKLKLYLTDDYYIGNSFPSRGYSYSVNTSYSAGYSDGTAYVEMVTDNSSDRILAQRGIVQTKHKDGKFHVSFCNVGFTDYWRSNPEVSYDFYGSN